MKKLIPLHILFLIYSCVGIVGKFAARQEYLSIEFFALYGLSLIILVVYSIFWQRMLLIMPLVNAFSHKGVTVVWAIIWGILFLGESISMAKIIAAILIITGIAVIGVSDE